MKLSDDQILQLFRFTEKKQVHWYDLQAELVDHLASRIEEEMSLDPVLSFDAALEKVYKGFGIFGFARIVQEKSAQLQRQAEKTWRRAVIDFFGWPKLLLLAMIAALSWQMARVFDAGILLFCLMVAEVAASLVLVREVRRLRKRRKRLLLLEAGTGYYFSLLFVYQIVLFSSDEGFGVLAFCLLATAGVLIQWANFSVFLSMKKKAQTLYPELT